jgi:hypothetical protein
MISTPTSKSRTERKLVAAISGHSGATRGDRDAEINTLCMLKRNEHEREPRERVCRSGCRQTSLLYHSRRSMPQPCSDSGSESQTRTHAFAQPHKERGVLSEGLRRQPPKINRRRGIMKILCSAQSQYPVAVARKNGV